METVVISLGGSVIVPNKIDTPFLKKFKRIVLDYVRNGSKAVIICGGGSIARDYMKAAGKVTKSKDTELDLIGISATKLNAQLLKAIFAGDVCGEIINDPNKRIITNKKIIIGGGWLPGWSTDYDAVLAAGTYSARRLINLSNVPYIYNKDPRKYKSAMKISEISWRDFRKIVGEKWVPGRNVPFDPVASSLAERQKLKVIMAKGTDLKNLENILKKKNFRGTIIG